MTFQCQEDVLVCGIELSLLLLVALDDFLLVLVQIEDRFVRVDLFPRCCTNMNVRLLVNLLHLQVILFAFLDYCCCTTPITGPIIWLKPAC